MNNDLKNILAASNKDIDNQELLSYLSKHLSQAENHEVEKTMAEDDFMNDAVEGLQQISNKNEIPYHLEKLNEGLLQQLAKKKERKKRRWKDNPQIYVVIVIILLLLMLCFVAIRKYGNSATGQHPAKPAPDKIIAEKSR